ncbi:hypothetical protein ACN47E_006347 [Coniothyrium glycines]
MVSLTTVVAHNSTLSKLPPNLVAVFVGGTSGIGLFTARELVLSTRSPTVYLIGRNATEASRITAELQSLNPSSRISFVQKDISLLHNVDAACSEIAARENTVNVLFMTCGYLTLKGRDPTPEGLDRKLALHYYSRLRFVQQLALLLAAAAESSTLSRVVSVMDPQAGLRAVPNWDDLSLTTTYSLKNCFVHASAMQNLAFYKYAKDMPQTGFVHAYPSGVETGVMREFPGVLQLLLKPFMFALKLFLLVPQKESGQRHLFAATSPRYAGRAVGRRDGDLVLGSDGVEGSGSYLLNWNGEALADTKQAERMRAEQGAEKVWKHTEHVFNKICNENQSF